MERMFSNRDLKRLIIPLIIEQILAVAVGMADIIMIGRAGESAISGVSLVNTINALLINIFAALATGGAVIAAQYIGKKDSEQARVSANQLLLISGILSLSIMGIVLIGNSVILRTIFGNVESSILENAQIYFLLSALSYPFLGLYNSCAGLFRAMGNSRVSMLTSLCMNIINVILNAVFVFGFGMGVAGVGLATLISRIFASVIMVVLIRIPRQEIYIEKKFSFKFNPDMIKKILRIGIPSGLENSSFQIGKILVLSLVASFGTSSIAANAVSGTVASFAVLPGVATGLALLTIVGQCVGAGNYEQAIYYTKKVMLYAFLGLAIVNAFIIIFAPAILSIYSLTEETASIAQKIIVYHSICCIIIWPLSFSLPNALRAASDVKYTMIVSTISMWTFRIGFSYVLGRYMGIGVFGIWVAMTIDWLFRSTCFTIRFLNGKWKEKTEMPLPHKTTA
ncbi:putative MATE family efflux protein [Natranaerovirga pectinivora]|uniref:Probable multidrug resistance protein NorM n=1 Tax=Natranaerovirga pectinivora TaxID=682400 RepID=A0A4R3MMD2_9FIRM|nr:MATE family efflux transporter [Natranaerovirga pectinivora]TCT16095.1 putative MATE family efflux protein [Natranaerovirga pectinivora]